MMLANSGGGGEGGEAKAKNFKGKYIHEVKEEFSEGWGVQIKLAIHSLRAWIFSGTIH